MDRNKGQRIKQILNDMSAAQQFKRTIEGDWPIKDGDKVYLNLDAIKKRPGYEEMLPAYRRFCEENAEKIFTVMYDKSLRQSVVSLVEDESNPKWLFWIGDLKKVE